MNDHVNAPEKPVVPEKLPSGRKQKIVKIVVVTSTAVVLFSLILVTSALAAKNSAENKIFRNITVASIDVGGLDKLAATEVVQRAFERMVDQGLQAELFNETSTIDLNPTGASDPDLVYPLVDLDVNALIEKAYMTGRDQGTVINFLAPLWYTSVGRRNVPADVTLAETKLTDAIRVSYPAGESAGKPTDFTITGEGEDMVITVTPAVTGSTIDLKNAFTELKKDAQDLRLVTLKLHLIERSAVITAKEAETLIPAVKQALANGPYALTFSKENAGKLSFDVSTEQLRDWLQPDKDDNGEPVLTLNTTSMGALLADIHIKLDVSAQDAVFVQEGNRVTSFSPSRDGVRADDDALIDALVAAFQSGAKEVAISVEKTEPAITTESSNDLGIKELLGTGFSSYKGSPSNRRANIRHGADKLNGLLVAPGETLSLLENLRPFTVADGYLPELVIKGDQIIPEIGGGLCQIGTTTFRAAMNSGLDIAERRNHSLVVSYYNDPANGKPGTDATIYDPAPDLKIKNDTPNYIMLITENRTDTSELHFHFWGASDGRQGSYTPPQVLSWSGYGATITKETDTLAPGVKSCQSPHPGATASFTYNISRVDGTITSREFVSTYRSLPTICLVGKASGSPAPVVEGVSTGGEAIPVE